MHTNTQSSMITHPASPLLSHVVLLESSLSALQGFVFVSAPQRSIKQPDEKETDLQREDKIKKSQRINWEDNTTKTDWEKKRKITVEGHIHIFRF